MKVAYAIFPSGNESSTLFSLSGAKVPLAMELSLPGAKVRGNESSTYPLILSQSFR